MEQEGKERLGGRDWEEYSDLNTVAVERMIRHKAKPSALSFLEYTSINGALTGL